MRVNGGAEAVLPERGLVRRTRIGVGGWWEGSTELEMPLEPHSRKGMNPLKAQDFWAKEKAWKVTA